MRTIYAAILVIAELVAVAAASDYGAWSKASPDGAWTLVAEAAVLQSSLPQLVPADAALYCPRYAHNDTRDRVRFWVALVSAMARPESNFDPSAEYVEPQIRDASKNNVVSRGLLQISFESANQRRYGCRINQPEELHDPASNLACAIKILNYWVTKDNSIGMRDGANRGGAKYWSVLRRNKHVSEIKGFTRRLSFCAAIQP